MTLIELLVAMAVLGIIFTAILSWQGFTIQASANATSTADQLRKLNDVTGYLGDRVRAAQGIRTAGFTVNPSSAVGAGACNATYPCLALLVPEASAGTAISRCLYLIYRIEPRSALSDADKAADAWADENTKILREYRVVNNTTTKNCNTFKADFDGRTTFSGISTYYLLVDGLTITSSTGVNFVPFAYDTVQRLITLRIRAKQRVRGQEQYAPRNSPYEFTLRARNVQ